MKVFKPETSFAKILFYGDPGSGKCVVGGTQIQLADGRRLPIEQITQPTILLTWTGQAFTPAVCNSVEAFGNKLCCKLTTFTGRELEASVDHPVLTTEGWKVMKDITPGDYLILPWCIDYDFGGNLTSAEAKLLGYLIGDGCITSGNVTFVTADPDTKQRFKGVVSELGYRLNPLKHKSPVCWQVGVSGGVRSWLRSFGLYGCDSGSKFVPEEVFVARSEVILDFLAAYFECDGTIDSGRRRAIQYDSKSLELLRGVQELLMRFGIASRIRKTFITYKDSVYWRLTASGESACKFVDFVPFAGHKRDRLPNDWQEKNTSGEYFGGIPTSLVRKGVSISNSWGYKKYGLAPFSRYETRETSREKLLRYAEVVRETRSNEAEYIEEVVREDIFYDRVVDVSETGTKPVFNVEVPKYHTLVTNGIVTHNTTLLGTIMDDERTKPCLWLDCGGNPESIRLNTSLPTILQIEKPEDLNGPYEWLRKGQPDNHPFVTICEKLGTHLTPPYKSVVSVDCLTELQRQYIKQFSGNTDKQPGDALAPVEIREWGTTLMAMINMMSMYKNLPMHVFATCHEDDKKNRDGAVISTGVWLWGQGRIEVPAYMLAQIRLVRTNELPATMQKKATELEPEAMNIAYFDKLGPFDVKQQYVKKRLGWMPAPTITKVLDVLEIH